MRLLTLITFLFTLSACSDGRWAPGYLITEEGETLSNTAENKRALTVTTMVSQLDKDLAPHWRTEITIAELPRYERGADDDRGGGWMWSVATVTITLLGDGNAEPRVNETQITKAVTDYLYRQVERPGQNLKVTTTRVVDAARFAAKPTKTVGDKPAESVDKPPVPPAPATRTYVVQTGDTWAELSQAFYGSSQHWRHLSDANQGGDLSAGRTIVIPSKP